MSRVGSALAAIARKMEQKGIANHRSEAVYKLLVADGPMCTKEIAQELDWPMHQVMGSAQALDLLEAEGLARRVPGHNNSFMWYAVEDDE